ncbi:MAG: tRNA dihydrouridine synthase DusB [Clostridia bacterium]|nr:tRNA dihydrouridine synthase DusB [Clostridia bacterium]
MNIFKDFTNPPLILAPMAGMADNAFRILCKNHGADIVYSEMISAKAVYYNDAKTFQLASFDSKETPLILQIFGSEPEILAYAAKKLFSLSHPCGIDINMGCPVHKIVSNGEGCALMKNPALVYEIVSRVREVLPPDIPVSVKIRKGIDSRTENFVQVALSAQKGGADFIALHGRTREQMYSGKADYDAIKQLKDTLKIKVIGNGDVVCTESYDNLVKTGCDGVMIGRGSFGNPFIFENIKRHRQNLPPLTPSVQEIKETIFNHIELALKYKSETVALRETRKHISCYLKGFHGSASLRNLVNRAETKKELYEIINSVKD